MSNNVHLVISRSQSTQTLGEDIENIFQKALVGIATSEAEALQLIAQDHLEIMKANRGNPFVKPVSKINDTTYKIQGENYYWSVIPTPINIVVNQEL